MPNSCKYVNYLFTSIFFLIVLGKFRERFHKGNKVAVHDNWSSSSESSLCQKPS